MILGGIMKFSLTGFVFSFMILPIAIVANPSQKNLSEASIPNPTQKSVLAKPKTDF
jgi:hypothetical protein